MIPENFNFEGGCSATTLRKFGASDKRFPCAAMDFGSGCAASETLIMSAWNFVITATGGYVKATGFSGAQVRIARARINGGGLIRMLSPLTVSLRPSTSSPRTDAKSTMVSAKAKTEYT